MIRSAMECRGEDLVGTAFRRHGDNTLMMRTVRIQKRLNFDGLKHFSRNTRPACVVAYRVRATS